jgi:sarcosine oxidase subunit gamma
VSEQSHGRQVVRVEGPAARALLERLCRLDLHPRRVAAGYCAQTTVAGIGCLVHQRDATPAFDLVVYAGYAQAFWERLTHTAASFGYRVVIEQLGD